VSYGVRASVWLGRWSPGVGDPTVIGWVTTLGYFAASVLALRAGMPARDRPVAKRDRLLWRGIAAFLFALGLNKQLDLQTALTEIGRTLSYRTGWHEVRRTVEFWFVVLFGVAALAVIVGLAVLVRSAGRELRIAVAGLALVGGFVVVRAATFHHVDHFRGARWVMASSNWVFELGGIVLVGIGAVRELKRRPPLTGRKRR
jgi:hypothetical protein